MFQWRIKVKCRIKHILWFSGCKNFVPEKFSSVGHFYHHQYFVSVTGFFLPEVIPCIKVTFGNAISLEIKPQQRKSHFKGVYISMLLKVVQPWAAWACRSVLDNIRTLIEIGPGYEWMSGIFSDSTLMMIS